MPDRRHVAGSAQGERALVRRGEIYYCFLDPVFGREMGGYKTRPVAVVSINDVNRNLSLATIVPGTSADGKPSHHRNVALVPANPTNGLKNDTTFLCHQLRALDIGRFTSKRIGVLSPRDLQCIEEAIKFNLGIP